MNFNQSMALLVITALLGAMGWLFRAHRQVFQYAAIIIALGCFGAQLLMNLAEDMYRHGVMAQYGADSAAVLRDFEHGLPATTAAVNGVIRAVDVPEAERSALLATVPKGVVPIKPVSLELFAPWVRMCLWLIILLLSCMYAASPFIPVAAKKIAGSEAESNQARSDD